MTGNAVRRARSWCCVSVCCRCRLGCDCSWLARRCRWSHRAAGLGRRLRRGFGSVACTRRFRTPEIVRLRIPDIAPSHLDHRTYEIRGDTESFRAAQGYTKSRVPVLRACYLHSKLRFLHKTSTNIRPQTLALLAAGFAFSESTLVESISRLEPPAATPPLCGLLRPRQRQLRALASHHLNPHQIRALSECPASLSIPAPTPSLCGLLRPRQRQHRKHRRVVRRRARVLHIPQPRRGDASLSHVAG